MLVSLRETVAPVGCKWTVIQVGETAVPVLVYLPSLSTMVTVVVFPPGETMSRGFVGCIISWNLSFPSTMVSPKIAMAATQTAWPCAVVDGITTSLAYSMKSAEPEHTFRNQVIA